jgi:hypothetical protein
MRGLSRKQGCQLKHKATVFFLALLFYADWNPNL